MKKTVIWLIFIFLILPGCKNQTVSGLEQTDNTNIAMLEGLPTVISAQKHIITVGEFQYEALKINTSHYIIYTTVTDRLILRRLPMLLESAWQNFQTFSPNYQSEQRVKGNIYYFRDRQQWLDFSRAFAPESFHIFEQVRSGAYCHNRTCVAWQISRQADFSVLTHEAWHQYCDLNFSQTLPSWLAESSAVYLEAYKWDAQGLSFSPRYNLNRLAALKLSINAGINFSIEQLTGSDPGAVITSNMHLTNEQSDMIISAYYARLYALARFFFEFEYGIYRKPYLNIFTDLYNGSAKLPQPLLNADIQEQKTRLWNMQAGQYLYNLYLGSHNQLIEQQYQAFCLSLASSVKINQN